MHTGLSDFQTAMIEACQIDFLWLELPNKQRALITQQVKSINCQNDSHLFIIQDQAR